MTLKKVASMKGNRFLTWSIPVLVVSLFVTGCGKSERSGGEGSLKGTAVVASIKETAGYMVSKKDPFNPANGIESTRKQRPGAFGTYKGEMPPETPTIEAVGAVLNNGMAPKMTIGSFENTVIVRSNFPFDYENDNAALKSLYDLHGLDKVVRNDMTELEKAVALMSYTRKFLSGGSIPGPETENGPSAFLITKNRREKGLGGGSDVHAALMCQLALSCGLTARMVGMHNLDGSGTPLTYDVCEVYLNARKKWAAFDPYTLATYFTRSGKILSALDLHVLAAENRMREATAVSESGSMLDLASVRDQVVSKFRYIYIWRMNDILGKSPRTGSIPWETLYQSHLVWEDQYSPVSSGGFEKTGRFADGEVQFVTHIRSDFEWTLNAINVTIQRIGPTKVVYHIDTVTPNFERFDAWVNDKVLKTGNVFTVDNREQRVQITSVNGRGVKSPSAFVDIMCE